MKKSFSIIELVISLIIIGILAVFSSNLLIKIYKSYFYVNEFNKLSFELDSALDMLASKLKYRIKNSLIGVDCNLSLNKCIEGEIDSFYVLNNSNPQILEWIGIDEYSKMGIWSESIKQNIPGFSGFIDLNKTKKLNNEYILVSPDSNFSIVKIIDGNWSFQYGLKGDVFSNQYEVLIFSGKDGRGDFEDINNSYGFYKKFHNKYNIKKVFEIKNYHVFLGKNGVSNTNITIKPLYEKNSSLIFEKYYLVNSAYAIVPSVNKDIQGKVIDYNLTLFYNYFPWRGETFTDGNRSLILSHVSRFKFFIEDGILKIFVCLKSQRANFSVCKTKVVF